MRIRLALAALLLVVGGVVPLLAGPGARPIHVKLVAAPYLSSAPFFVAQDLGLFAAEGLEVEFVKIPGHTASLPALAQGRVDVVGAMIAPALFNLAQRGASIRIVAARAFADRAGCVASAIVARKDLVAEGRLGTPSALRGLRFAFDRTDPGFFFVDTLLRSAGMSIKDIEVSDVASAIRGDALQRDLIDLTASAEPGLTQILDSGAAEVWKPYSEILPDFQYTYVLFGSRLTVDDRETGRRFLRGYLAGVERYLDEGKSPRLVEIVARNTHLDADFLRRACWAPTSRDGKVDAASLERYQAWAHREGLIDEPVAVDKLVDQSLLAGASEPTGGGK